MKEMTEANMGGLRALAEKDRVTWTRAEKDGPLAKKYGKGPFIVAATSTLTEKAMAETGCLQLVSIGLPVEEGRDTTMIYDNREKRWTTDAMDVPPTGRYSIPKIIDRYLVLVPGKKF